jgi:hypothetical protein
MFASVADRHRKTHSTGARRANVRIRRGFSISRSARAAAR